MKHKTIILLAAGLLVVAVFAVAADHTPSTVPSAYAPVRNHTFQTVLEGSEVVHAFVLHNQGSAPLQIEDVKTG